MNEEEWPQMTGEALDIAEFWKEQAVIARRRAERWKQAAKRQRRGWRDAFAALQRAQARFAAIRDHITPATAYPETVAWVQATVDAVVKPKQAE